MTGFPRWPLIALAALFAGYFVILAVTTYHLPRDPLPSMIATVLFAVLAAISLIGASTAKMHRAVALLLLVGGVAVTLLCMSQLSPEGDLGYATWFIGANGVLMTIAITRGRTIIAWTGVAVQVALTAVWYASPAAITSGIVGSIMWVLVAQLIINGLDKVGEAIRRYGAAELQTVQLGVLQDAHRHERQERLEQTARAATPILQRIIAADGDLSEEDRRECLLVEAAIRDEIRGRRLLSDRVRAEVASARRRGVTVMLLDEGGLDDVEDADPMLAAVADAIAGFDGDRVMVRTAPGAEPLVTVVGLVGAGGATGLRDEESEGEVGMWLEVRATSDGVRAEPMGV